MSEQTAEPSGPVQDQQDPDDKGEVNVEEEEEEEEEEGPSSELFNLIHHFQRMLGLNSEETPPVNCPIKELTLAGVANAIKSGVCRKIVILSGAGISTSAGIPDFRSKNGLYTRLDKYNLPYPEAVFEISFFRDHPEPFLQLARDLFPSNFSPTPTHYFIRLLHQKGVLLRNFTQNIDTLERRAGIPADKLIEAHGSFSTCHCIGCGREHDSEQLRKAVFEEPIRVPVCECGSLIKWDIVFFGESLPERFFQCRTDISPNTPRLLLNMEVPTGFKTTGSKDRDIIHLGPIDDSIRELAKLLDWGADLDVLISAGPVDIYPTATSSPAP